MEFPQTFMNVPKMYPDGFWTTIREHSPEFTKKILENVPLWSSQNLHRMFLCKLTGTFPESYRETFRKDILFCTVSPACLFAFKETMIRLVISRLLNSLFAIIRVVQVDWEIVIKANILRTTGFEYWTQSPRKTSTTHAFLGAIPHIRHIVFNQNVINKLW